MTTAPSTAEKFLTELTEQVDNVVQVVHLSADGIAQVAVGGTKDDAEYLAAIGSGLHSLAHATRSHLRRLIGDSPDRPALPAEVIELPEGSLVAMAAGEGSVLLVLAKAGADFGHLRHCMVNVVKRIGERALTTPSRHSGPVDA